MLALYTCCVPRLWDNTIDGHRRAVRDATLDTAAALVAEHGLTAVTMSKIAEKAGIGRATLYKYFPDVESILSAWHERQIAAHLEQLAEARDRATGAMAQLEAVLRAYARIQHDHVQRHRPEPHGAELAALLHPDEHVARAQRHLRDLLGDLIAAAATSGDVRADVAPAELATYCVHALTAAAGLPSKAAVDRLVTITIAGLDSPN